MSVMATSEWLESNQMDTSSVRSWCGLSCYWSFVVIASARCSHFFHTFSFLTISLWLSFHASQSTRKMRRCWATSLKKAGEKWAANLSTCCSYLCSSSQLTPHRRSSCVYVCYDNASLVLKRGSRQSRGAYWPYCRWPPSRQRPHPVSQRHVDSQQL